MSREVPSKYHQRQPTLWRTSLSNLNLKRVWRRTMEGGPDRSLPVMGQTCPGAGSPRLRRGTTRSQGEELNRSAACLTLRAAFCQGDQKGQAIRQVVGPHQGKTESCSKRREPLCSHKHENHIPPGHGSQLTEMNVDSLKPERDLTLRLAELRICYLKHGSQREECKGGCILSS